MSNEEIEELKARLKESNRLLRSAYQIAVRNGEQTSWQPFRDEVNSELLRQFALDNRDKIDSFSLSMTIVRATGTPEIYRTALREE